MNIALIIAGGSGARMQQDIPKQFISVEDKPVIVYTMEAFQAHPIIDEIVVVCLDGWHEILRAYALQFNISKMTSVVLGGKNGQESIRNGVYEIAKNHADNDIILIHDAIRPMTSADIISDCVATAKKFGNAIVTIPCAEVMLLTDDDTTATKSIDRSTLKRTQTPQAFKLVDLLNAHKLALEKGMVNSIASASMFVDLGYTVHFSRGSEKNIKLTCTEDIEIFKALLNTRKESWMK